MLDRIKHFFREHLSPDNRETADAEKHRLQLAVAALLLEMTRMDGDVRPEQCARVESAIREQFGLSGDETRELIELADAERNAATDYFQFTVLINGEYTREQKSAVIEQLWAVALANDALHRHEEHLVRKIAQLLHVSHGDFIAAKHRASNAV